MALDGVPTGYSGVCFRSRLEARWAVFFDLLGWPWEYEPIDLAGYIPDFVLPLPAGRVLVEVKPVFSYEDALLAAREKLDDCGWRSANRNDALIVGASWRIRGEAPLSHLDFSCAIRRWPSESPTPLWSEARWHRCGTCGAVSMHHFVRGYGCTLCGSPAWETFLAPQPDRLRDRWYQAGNVVAWGG